MKNKEPTPPTPEEIAIQLKEFGEVLGFNKEKFVELVAKKCNNCLSCKCKKDEKED